MIPAYRAEELCGETDMPTIKMQELFNGEARTVKWPRRKVWQEKNLWSLLGKPESTTRKLKPGRKTVRDKQKAALSGRVW